MDKSGKSTGMAMTGNLLTICIGGRSWVLLSFGAFAEGGDTNPNKPAYGRTKPDAVETSVRDAFLPSSSEDIGELRNVSFLRLTMTVSSLRHPRCPNDYCCGLTTTIPGPIAPIVTSREPARSRGKTV